MTYTCTRTRTVRGRAEERPPLNQEHCQAKHRRHFAVFFCLLIVHIWTKDRKKTWWGMRMCDVSGLLHGRATVYCDCTGGFSHSSQLLYEHEQWSRSVFAPVLLGCYTLKQHILYYRKLRQKGQLKPAGVMWHRAMCSTYYLHDFMLFPLKNNNQWKRFVGHFYSKKQNTNSWNFS